MKWPAIAFVRCWLELKPNSSAMSVTLALACCLKSIDTEAEELGNGSHIATLSTSVNMLKIYGIKGCLFDP